MTDNTDIIRRIRDLRIKAENDGCTEDEAMQCAAMAAKMMTKYDVSESDLMNAAETGNLAESEVTVQRTKKVDPAVEAAMNDIAALTETRIHFRVWRRGSTIVRKIPVITGLAADREFAQYLIELVRNAGNRGWKQAMKTRGFSSKNQRARTSYKMGIGGRIGDRLEELHRERVGARDTGSALVILKNTLIEQALADTNIKTPRTRTRTVDNEAYTKGYMDGDNVSINRPLDDGSQPTVSIT